MGRLGSLTALFIGFLRIALLGSSGGGVVFARHLLVDQRRWMDDNEFAEILGFCRLMPGPNMLGVAVCVGARVRGLPGAVVSAAGFIVLPLGIGFPIGALLLSNSDLGVLDGTLRGISSAAAGLLLGTGLRLFWPNLRQPGAVLIAVLAAGALVATKLPLAFILLVLVPLSIANAALSRTGVDR
jgi:chromate transporter